MPPLATPVTLSESRYGSIPRFYVATTRDNAVSYDLQKWMLERSGGVRQIVAIDSSHSPMLSQPEALAQAIRSFGPR